MIARRTLLAATLAAMPSIAHAWDSAGHMLVDQIAWTQLKPGARTRATELVRTLENTYNNGQPYNFVTAGAWMDDMRSKKGYAWSKWHYVNIDWTADGVAFALPEPPHLVWAIGESLKTHLGMDKAARKVRTLELLNQVGITDPERRLSAFPHQLSGGMSQRVMIAMALACKPKLLIADEPSTALDVTIQAQILDLLLKLRQETNMGLVLITHDMGVVAETADRVIVQYAGRQVEQSPTRELFRDPHHPYTHGLLAALPERATGRRLPAITGVVPGQFDRPPGCLFAPRCPFAFERCHKESPPQAAVNLGRALCFTPLVAGKPVDTKVPA